MNQRVNVRYHRCQKPQWKLSLIGGICKFRKFCTIATIQETKRAAGIQVLLPAPAAFPPGRWPSCARACEGRVMGWLGLAGTSPPFPPGSPPLPPLAARPEESAFMLG